MGRGCFLPPVVVARPTARGEKTIEGGRNKGLIFYRRERDENREFSVETFGTLSRICVLGESSSVPRPRPAFGGDTNENENTDRKKI